MSARFVSSAHGMPQLPMKSFTISQNLSTLVEILVTAGPMANPGNADRWVAINLLGTASRRKSITESSRAARSSPSDRLCHPPSGWSSGFCGCRARRIRRNKGATGVD
jgi:hypothetical protein